jgi:4-hydroxy-tetrahydrodipicolinate synthase
VNWTFGIALSEATVMTRHIIEGIYIPLITPFTPDGRLATDALESLAHDALNGGARGVVALGTTGEPALLTVSERHTVVDVCARVCRERSATLIVGAGSNDTAGSVEAVRELRARPEVTAVLAIVPYHLRPGEDGVVAHFTAVAAASPVPLIVYHIPYRTGQALGAATLRRLAEVPGVIGFKYAAGGIDADTIALLADLPGDVAVLAGDDVLASPLLALGAAGGILASAHVRTEEFVALADAWRSGDVERGRALGHRLARVSAALSAEPNPAVVKAVLHAQGRIPSPSVRLPLLPASAEATARAVRCVEATAAVVPVSA